MAETHTGVSTFRNTGTVSVHGGTFLSTGALAEQSVDLGSDRQPQTHIGPQRSSRHRDQRPGCPYPRPTRRNRSDPEMSLTSGAAPLPTTSTNRNQHATFGHVDRANVSGGVFVTLCHGLPSEGTGVEITRTDRNPSTGPGGLVRPSNAETNIPPTVRAGYDIYYYQLLAERRGSPMWIPGPDMNLPTEYRREGTSIGDVGILYCSEGFGFLFNIFLPADHPINRGRVPPGFEPLNLPIRERESRKQVVFGPKSYLTSTSVATSSDMDSSGFIFETSATEGAVIIMPDGAITEDLMCRKSIKEYLAKNAKTWYEFVREVREWEVNNGDIRLVIGSDKVSSWGIATSACSVGERVRLKFTNVGDISQTYTWRCDGRGSGRVGPCDQEMEGISLLEGGRSFPLRNQCVFLRTLNFDLSGTCWNDLVNHRIRSGDQHVSDSRPPGDYKDSRPGHQVGPDAGGSDGGGSHTTTGNVTFYATQSCSSVTHPSSSINKILLDKYPKAQIAIIEDADWISVINEDEVEIPKADELCARLLATRDVCEEDGIITFRSEEGFIDFDDTSRTNFGSKNRISDSDVAMDPSKPLHLIEEEKGKGLETRNFQDHRPRSASEVIPPAALPQLPAQSSTALPTNKLSTMPNRSGIMKPCESSETATQGSPSMVDLVVNSLTSLGDPTTIRPQSHSDEIGPAFASFQTHHDRLRGPLPSPPPSRHNSGEQNQILHRNDLPSTTSASGSQPSHRQKPLLPATQHHRRASSGFRSRGTQPLTSVGTLRMSPYPTPTASPQVISTKLEDPNDQSLGAGLGLSAGVISGIGGHAGYPQEVGSNASKQPDGSGLLSGGGYQSVHSISGGDQDPVAKQNVTSG